MAFYVGQKVVCVDGERTNLDSEQEITTGRVYTVGRVYGDINRFVIVGTPAEHSRGVGLDLIEVPGRGVPFAATRFRPITERKTSIDIFKAMLNPSKTEVEA